MKVKILKKCFTGTMGNMFAGEEHDLPDTIGQKLVDRGFAEEAKKKAGRPKKTLENRAADAADIETPEDE